MYNNSSPKLHESFRGTVRSNNVYAGDLKLVLDKSVVFLAPK